jgi:O-antigen/teichoic acid export membrane protein
LNEEEANRQRQDLGASLEHSEEDDGEAVIERQGKSQGPPDMRAREISRGVGSLTAQNLATGFLTFVFLTSLLRLLSNIQYGAYSAVLITTTIAGTVATFGLQAAAARYVALLRQRGDEEGALAAARSIVFLSLIIGAIVSGAFAISSPFLSVYFMKSSRWTGVFLLGTIWLFSYSLSVVLQGVVQGFKRYVLLAKMLFLARAAMVGFTVAGLLVFQDVSVPIAAWVVFSATVIFWTIKVIGRDLLRRNMITKRTGRTFSYTEILKYSAPIAAAGFALNFAAYADSIVVGGYLGPVMLGTYNAAVTISGIMSVVLLIPLVTAFLPEASSSSSDPIGVSNGLRLGFRFVTLAILPASFLIAALSVQLMTLFSGGDGYLIGAQSLEIIALTYVFYSIMSVIYYLLQALGRPLEALVIGGLSACADVALSLALVPSLGLLGAALSKGLVALVGMAVGLYLARGYAKNHDSLKFYAKGFVSSLIPFVVVLALSNFYSHRTFTLVPYFLLGSLLFVISLKVMKVLTEEDRRFLSHVIPQGFKWILRYLT